MINKITYKTDEEYRLRQLERQKSKIICECGCVLSYSSYRPHQKSNKHTLMLFKIEHPIEYENQILEKKLIKKLSRRGEIYNKIREIKPSKPRTPAISITRTRGINGRFQKLRDMRKYNQVNKSMKLILDVPMG